MALTRLTGSQLLHSNANLVIGTGVTVNSTGIVLAGTGITVRVLEDRPALDIQINSNTTAAVQIKNGGGSAPAALHVVDAGNSTTHYGLFVGGSDFGNFTTNPVLVTKNDQVGIGSTLPTTNFKLDISGNLTLGAAAGTDNTYIDQKQNGNLRLINSGRIAGSGEVSINQYNTASGGTTYYRDFVAYDGKNRKVIRVDGSKAETSIGIGDTTTLLVRPNTASGVPHLLVQMKATNGQILMGDKYTGTESQSNWGVGYSNAHTVLGAFCGPSDTYADTFVSTQDVAAAWQTALTFGGHGLKYYQTTSSSTVSVGSTVTTVSKFGVNTSGHVTKPYQPSFFALSSGNQTDSVVLYLTPNHSQADSAGNTHFNNSNGRFTAPIDGKYVFFASIMSNSYRAYHYWHFRVNGVTTGDYHHSHSDVGESYRTTSGTAIISLAANDYVDVKIYGRTYGTNWSSFGGYLLG
jgi:hypothetical protein